MKSEKTLCDRIPHIKPNLPVCDKSLGDILMKKLEESLSESLPPVKFFREDLEELYGLFKEVSEKVEIKGDGYEFDDLDDLFSYRKAEINKLEFKIRSPYVSIRFSSISVWLYSDDNTNLQYGLYEKIKKFVKKRTNMPFLLVSGYAGLIIGGILANIGVYILPYHLSSFNPNDSQSLIKGFLLIFLGFVWFVYSYRNTFYKHSQIYLIYKNNNTASLFSRYKDYIFTIVVSAISLIISHQWK